MMPIGSRDSLLRSMSCLLGFAILSVFCDFVANADTEMVGGIEWTYHVEDGKAIVGMSEEKIDDWGNPYSSYTPAVPTDTAGAVVIPTKLGGCPVTGVGDYAFEECGFVTSITIPNGVVKIGDGAFGWCNRLTKIIIPASVAEIGESAFCWCSKLSTISLASGNKHFVYAGSMLMSKDKKTVHAVSRSATAISVPNGVEVLPYGFLAGCSKLKTVTLPKSVVDTVDGWEDAFGYGTCTNLKEIKVDDRNPAVKAVNNLLIYKDDPSSVAYIPAGLSTVTISASVHNIDLYTAVKCTKIVVAANNPWYKSSGVSVLSKDGKTFVAAPPALTSVIVPYGVKTIAAYAFLYSRNATVTIPSSVTQIGDDESEYMAYSSVFGSGVKSILFLGNPPIMFWKDPFRELKDGWNGEIRVSLYSVDEWKSYFSENAPFFEDRVVGGIPGEPTFRCVSRETYNWGNAEDGEFEPDYGEGVVIVGGSNIKGTVTIPKQINGYTVTGIGRGAFNKNKSITAVMIPETVNRIGYNAFGSCKALKSVTIAGGEDVEMGQFSFSGCDALAKNGFVVVNGVLYHYTGKGGAITIPSTVRIIDDEVFRNNKNITAVNIPGTVKLIRDEAFEYCPKLTRATIAEGCERLGDLAFYGCPLARFNVPSTVYGYEYDWETAVWYSRKLKSLTIADMDNMGWIADSLARGAKLNTTVSVAFDPTGGTIEGPADENGIARITVPYLDAIWSVLPNGLFKAVRKGYTFQGWYTAKTKGVKVSVNTTVSKSVTYYARWKPNKYKVTVSAGVGGKAAKTGSYDCGSTVKFTATPSKGYVFVRWDDAEFDEAHDDTYEVLWSKYAKQYRQNPLSLKIPAGNLSLRAVFAKTALDSAAPAVHIGWDGEWNLEENEDAVIPVSVDGSLSFPSVKATNLPPGVSLVMADDDEHYVLKVSDHAKLRPGVRKVTITATNRSGKKGSATIEIVGRNVTAALEKGFIYDLDTATSGGYAFKGGIAQSWTLADIGVSLASGCKLVNVTGLPSGWKFANGKVYGTAAPGKYAIFFTVAKGKTSYQASATFTLEPLPPWVTGSFYGTLWEHSTRYDYALGRIQLSVSSAGKVSGKLFFVDMKKSRIVSSAVSASLKYNEASGNYTAKFSAKVAGRSFSWSLTISEDESATVLSSNRNSGYSYESLQLRQNPWSRRDAATLDLPNLSGLTGQYRGGNGTVRFGSKGAVTIVEKDVLHYSGGSKKVSGTSSAQVVGVEYNSYMNRGTAYISTITDENHLLFNIECLCVEYSYYDGEYHIDNVYSMGL